MMSLIKNMNLKLENEEPLGSDEFEVGEMSTDVIDSDLDKMEDIGSKLSVANEALDILYNSSVSDTVANNIAYVCGMLGAKYDYIKTEDLHLNTESKLREMVEAVWVGIKKLWTALINFFKTTWKKIQIWYYSLTKNIFNLRKKVYGLRNKSPIVVSSEQYKQFLKDFQIYTCYPGVYQKDNPKTVYNIAQLIKEYLGYS